MINALSHAGIIKEGDCGACCLGAILGKTVKEIYDFFPEPRNIAYHDVITVLQKSGTEYFNHFPILKFHDMRPDWFHFGFPGHHNWIAWFDQAESFVNAGKIGMAHVNLQGRANTEDYVDHWVLIQVEKHGSNAIDKIVNVSCPTKGNYNVVAKDFLWKYGGYNTIWVTPKNSV